MPIADPLRLLPRLLLAAAVMLPSLLAPTWAQEIDLRQAIANGKWELAYQRTGLFKPFQLKHQEEGKSYTCIQGDPRRKLLDWIASKGCRIDQESLQGDIYRLKGECTLKWLPKYPIPAEVELRFGDDRHFTLDIRASENALLSYSEHTLASHQGECDKPPATVQGKKAPRPGS